jgi:hypothetical protein
VTTRPTRLTDISWSGPHFADGEYALRLQHDKSGRLAEKQVTAWDPDGLWSGQPGSLHTWEQLRYGYDDLGRADHLTEGGRLREATTYDLIGNLVSMTRSVPGLPDLTWEYAASPRNHEVPGRTTTLPGGTTRHDTYSYDPVTGRMTFAQATGPTWPPGVLDPEHQQGHRAFTYDGTGKLTHVAVNGLSQAAYGYDVDDQMVLREDHDQQKRWYTFNGLYGDEDGGLRVWEVAEPLMLVMTEQGAPQLVWRIVEPDGHPLAVLNADGTQRSFEISGLYGRPLYASGGWDFDRLHGEELERMGVRHVLHKDGQWLQPEPLLHLGLVGRLEEPGRLTGVYAGGDPVNLQDRSGYVVESGWDLLNVAMGVVSFTANVVGGRYGDAALDAVGVVVDTAALLTPGAPGGAGTAIQAARAGDAVADGVRAAGNAGEKSRGRRGRRGMVTERGSLANPMGRWWTRALRRRGVTTSPEEDAPTFFSARTTALGCPTRTNRL